VSRPFCPLRSFVDDGVLMTYWFAEADLYRQAAIIVDKVLKGRSRRTFRWKFELVINLKTANTLGLTMPRTLLARGDEIIE
jgi:putative ABC transport system substrate-binding protein